MSDFEIKSYLGDYPFFEESLFPIEIDGVIYEEEDAHIFVVNANEINLAIPYGTNPVLVAVDGEKKNYATEVKGKTFPGSTIHAIFDWDNTTAAKQDWLSDILQFGYNSATKQRNQLKNGRNAFRYMQEENFTAISDLDTSNITNMRSMFAYASSYNQDISQWDTSKVESMGDMFSYASDFNQDISEWDTSNVTDMAYMFNNAPDFNQDISEWDTSNVMNMQGMFYDASSFASDISKWDTSNVTNMHSALWGASDFNSDISGWDTYNVTNMTGMFYKASSFNQDLSQWCVTKISLKPTDFDTGATAWLLPKPDWGTCPRGENINFPEGYSAKDAHIFIANGRWVTLPIPSGTLPTFVAVNGADVTPTTLTARTVEVEEVGEDGVTTTTSENVEVAAISANNGDTIHAIFDWDNKNFQKQDWFSDILQFGLNSGGERNQLKSGRYAFRNMVANPKAIIDLDTSNLQSMNGMFEYSSFNSDISGWDTSKVTNMGVMFDSASSFNQDLSEWCVSLIGSIPGDFDYGATAWVLPRPVWGTCPRGENKP